MLIVKSGHSRDRDTRRGTCWNYCMAHLVEKGLTAPSWVSSVIFSSDPVLDKGLRCSATYSCLANLLGKTEYQLNIEYQEGNRIEKMVSGATNDNCWALTDGIDDKEVESEFFMET